MVDLKGAYFDLATGNFLTILLSCGTPSIGPRKLNRYSTKLSVIYRLVTWIYTLFTGKHLQRLSARRLKGANHLARPVAFKEPGPNGEIRVDHDLTENPLPTWKKLEDLVAKGKVRNIGVSKCVL
jgi:hypothetical protein